MYNNSMTKQTDTCYVAYFDCLGFECILNYTSHEKKRTWSALQDKVHPRFPLNEMMLRAQSNPQRSPEIWSFWSAIPLSELKELSLSDPQLLANTIRNVGTPLYTSIKNKQVIT